MKKALVLTLILQFTSTYLFAQSPNRYEVETLANPNAGKKDTREVNAVLIFEKNGFRIQSRRNKEVFKEFRYSDIKTVQHSYSKKAALSMSMSTALALSVLTGTPLFLLAGKKEKHWLTIATDDDYAVLKIENDNYRLIRMEFIVKKIAIVDIDENRQ
jgi:hypothetical protein